MSYVRDYLNTPVHDNPHLEIVNLTNIWENDFEFEFDSFKVWPWWSMIPSTVYRINSWQTIQVNKAVAFHWWFLLAKKIAYEKMWDAWLASETVWVNLAEKIITPMWWWNAENEVIEEKIKEEDDIKKLAYNKLQKLYSERTWKKSAWVKKEQMVAELS